MNTKPTILLTAVLCLLLAGCSKEADIPSSAAKAAAKVLEEPATINFTEPNVFPEGMTYDPFHNWFYVSSFTRGDIGIVTRDGVYRPFITDETLVTTTGLKVDKAHKRLMVSNAPNGIGAYDLNTGTRLFYTDLSTVLPGAPLFINDMALDPQGNAYVTNSFSPVIYKVDRDGHASVFFQNEDFATAPGEFGFNGIQYDERGYILVSVTTRNEIIKIPVRDPGTYSVVQLDTPLANPDGLLLSKDGKQLVVVNNAVFGDLNGKVFTLTSNDDWASGSLSTSYTTGPVFPSAATSDGKRVYVLYSYLNELLLSGLDRNTFTIQQVPLKQWNPF